MGGSEVLIDALIRGLKKNGGRLLLRSHVDKIHIENGRAAGVVLQPRTNGNGKAAAASSSSSSSSGGQPEFIRARKGVISNASVWDTQKLLAPGVGPKDWRRQSITTPAVSCQQSLAGGYVHTAGHGKGTSAGDKTCMTIST
jgi:phytoene dehydrogenase-like protein